MFCKKNIKYFLTVSAIKLNYVFKLGMFSEINSFFGLFILTKTYIYFFLGLCRIGIFQEKSV